MEPQPLDRSEVGLLPSASVRAGVIRSVETVLHLDPAVIVLSDESSLYELGLDSIIVVELLTELEVQFSITMEIDDLSEELFARLGNLVALVDSKLRD